MKYLSFIVIWCVPLYGMSGQTRASEYENSRQDIQYLYPDQVNDETYQREILRAQGISDDQIDAVQKRTHTTGVSMPNDRLNAESVIKKLMPKEHFTLDHAELYLAKIKEALSMMEKFLGVRDPGYERAQNYFERVLEKRKKHVSFVPNEVEYQEPTSELARQEALRSQGISDKEVKKTFFKKGREQEELRNAQQVIAMLMPNEVFTLEHVDLYLEKVKDARAVISSLGINPSEHERAQRYFEGVIKQNKENKR